MSSAAPVSASKPKRIALFYQDAMPERLCLLALDEASDHSDKIKTIRAEKPGRHTWNRKFRLVK